LVPQVRRQAKRPSSVFTSDQRAADGRATGIEVQGLPLRGRRSGFPLIIRGPGFPQNVTRDQLAGKRRPGPDDHRPHRGDAGGAPWTALPSCHWPRTRRKGYKPQPSSSRASTLGNLRASGQGAVGIQPVERRRGGALQPPGRPLRAHQPAPRPGSVWLRRDPGTRLAHPPGAAQDLAQATNCR